MATDSLISVDTTSSTKADAPHTGGLVRLKRSMNNLRERMRKTSLPNLHRPREQVPDVPKVPDIFSSNASTSPRPCVSPPVIHTTSMPTFEQTPSKSSHYLRSRNVSTSSADKSPTRGFTTVLRRFSGDDSETHRSSISSTASSAASSTSVTPTSARVPLPVQTPAHSQKKLPSLPVYEGSPSPFQYTSPSASESSTRKPAPAIPGAYNYATIFLN
ncbi:hypothetical protein MCUN1_001260 [Malassezia cuniculi]|uniref:Uncharacterized protein n=1 Tax=Malassezia cuniculi TaxID=948313 RepID=A0AAF0ESQ9_9BASI|nr:hypothetical protein MCUN1_001260 [Malassezia cuniculi]